MAQPPRVGGEGAATVSEQGVTDAYSYTIATICSRNAPSPAEHAARKERVYAAIERGSCCGRCGATLAPLAPVWRDVLSLARPGSYKQFRQLGPVCSACRPAWADHEAVETACAHCQRPVYQHRRPWRTERRPLGRYCCQRCRWTATNRERADALTAARRKNCTTCNQSFTPPRADGRYCSPACRQRAYRQRRHSEV